jgi:hypothetical protein
MNWWGWLLLVGYALMIVTAIVRRYPPIVYGVLITGLLVSALAAILRAEWLSYVSLGLLLAGIALFNRAKPRDRAA